MPISFERFITAIESCDYETFETYIQENQNNLSAAVDKSNPAGDSPLYVAMKWRRQQFRERLFELPELDVNFRAGEEGYTPLIQSARHRLGLSRLLSHPDIDVNATDFVGNTAIMHMTIYPRDLSQMRYLLSDPRIDLSVRNLEGKTAYEILEFYRPHCRMLPESLRMLDRLRELSGVLAYNPDVSNSPASDFFRGGSEPRSLTFSERLEMLDTDDEIIEIDDLFVCPVTHEIMNDPVTLSNGNTYDRFSIITWSRGQEFFHDPLTNLPLITRDELSRGSTWRIKSRIEEFVVSMERKYPVKAAPAVHEPEMKEEKAVGIESDEPRSVDNAGSLSGIPSIGGDDSLTDNRPDNLLEQKSEVDVSVQQRVIYKTRQNDISSAITSYRSNINEFDVSKVLNERYLFEILNDHNEFSPYCFVSLFFLKPRSAYLYCPEKYFSMYDLGLRELHSYAEGKNEDVRRAVDEIVRHAELLQNGSAEDRLTAMGAVWHTALVLKHPGTVEFYSFMAWRYSGSPSPRAKKLGCIMMGLGVLLLAAAALTAAGTLCVGGTAAIVLGVSGAALFASGAGMFAHGRRKGLSKQAKAVIDSAKPLARPFYRSGWRALI